MRHLHICQTTFATETIEKKKYKGGNKIIGYCCCFVVLVVIANDQRGEALKDQDDEFITCVFIKYIYYIYIGLVHDV